MPAYSPSILIVDDDSLLVEYWKTLLEGYGYEKVTLCTDSREVEVLFRKTEFDMVLLDLHMPNVSGQSLLPILRRDYPEMPVIIITALDKVDTAVECMKAGAFDFLTKPISENRLIPIVRHAARIRELQRKVSILENRAGSWEIKHPEAFSEIITTGGIMYTIFTYIEAIALSPKAVLISGESGTGKELIARAVHRIGGKPGKFVPVNVSGLDDTMFSDTLFGHTKGAFTGADSARKGLIEQAAGGTLFLDEIGDLEMMSQVKLLRLLQEEEFYPLGADKPEKLRARIITATNADLRAKQHDGLFRKDLYYRLMAHHIELPPLRDRLEDLPLLLLHFSAEAASQLGKKGQNPSPEVLKILSSYSFPGNIRELQAMVFDGVSRAETGVLSPEYIKNYLARQNRPREKTANPGITREILTPETFPTLKDVEDRYVDEALKLTGGNQSLAAKLLGVSQSTLSRRQKKVPPRSMQIE
jgi:DNA-binding NtrC family response regulator